MSFSLRILLIICSLSLTIICYKKVKQSQMKSVEAVNWIIGSIVLFLMSIFSKPIMWISNKLGIQSPANFVFMIFIGFILIQLFWDEVKISELNEKLKSLDHFTALKDYDENKKKVKTIKKTEEKIEKSK